MRITVTLDDDALAVIHRRMSARGVPFEQALNDAIREGVERAPRPAAFRTRVADLGVPLVEIDRVMQLAADLEDEELARRQRLGR